MFRKGDLQEILDEYEEERVRKMLHRFVELLAFGNLPLAPDVHKHRCPRCMGIWEHDGAQLQLGSDEGYTQAHLCPRGCGIDVRDRYFEEEVEISIK